MSILASNQPSSGGNEKPLSEECRETAVALRSIRAKLQEMIKDGWWPCGSFQTISIVIVSGWVVARALDRLGTDRQE